ncbi:MULTISPECIES: hypothetical protein [Erythrobacteraceae]|uniref:Uncharacterized protein n=1 Tax=Qipengyuania spongiae TaxID=2909673 RepID=A0ABY5SVZ0_9SPHN|nr:MULTISPECIES: hypothetical protein [Erythrobacteraceae]UVI38315.1 hypothetical protein L1F33_08560 [Qipengyuania spongiae]
MTASRNALPAGFRTPETRLVRAIILTSGRLIQDDNATVDPWQDQVWVLKDIDVRFHTVGAVLLGVPIYVRALMEHVERYGAHLNFRSKLVAIDGEARLATFEQKRGDEFSHDEERSDIIHDVPPQTAPGFVRSSPLAALSIQVLRELSDERL